MGGPGERAASTWDLAFEPLRRELAGVAAPSEAPPHKDAGRWHGTSRRAFSRGRATHLITHIAWTCSPGARERFL